MSNNTLDFFRSIHIPPHLDPNDIAGNLPLEYKKRSLQVFLFHMGRDKVFNNEIAHRMRLVGCNVMGDKQTQVFELVCIITVEEGVFKSRKRGFTHT